MARLRGRPFRSPPRALVGTSGYVYPHWRGLFYPEKLRARDRLSFYSLHFRTVELNNDQEAFAVKNARRLIELVEGAGENRA